jgi:hypothetical protein
MEFRFDWGCQGEAPMQRTCLTVALSLAIGVTVHLACGHAATTADDTLQPLITTSELIVGQNRFAFGLAKAGRLIERADVVVRLYIIEGTEASLMVETNAPFRPIENGEQGQTVHRHADGTRHTHEVGTDVRGLYVVQLSFSRAGDWGVELRVSQANGAVDSVRLAVTVQDTSPTPVLGSPAPRSRNLIASDVKNVREIDTSPQPDPRLHQVRIADAIAQGKPQLIVFATPQFCTSRMCGSVVDIVRTLLPTYGSRVAFTHQEIWQDFAEKKMFPTVEEWRLDTEPWIFVVDGNGIIRAKFEGLVTTQELETAVQQVLSPRRVEPK